MKRTRRKNRIVRHGKHAHIEEMDTIFEKGWLVRSGEKSQNRGFELYPDAEAYWSRIERDLDAEG